MSFSYVIFGIPHFIYSSIWFDHMGSPITSWSLPLNLSPNVSFRKSQLTPTVMPFRTRFRISCARKILIHLHSVRLWHSSCQMDTKNLYSLHDHCVFTECAPKNKTSGFPLHIVTTSYRRPVKKKIRESVVLALAELNIPRIQKMDSNLLFTRHGK
jgi:hypothetical protein